MPMDRQGIGEKPQAAVGAVREDQYGFRHPRPYLVLSMPPQDRMVGEVMQGAVVVELGEYGLSIARQSLALATLQLIPQKLTCHISEQLDSVTTRLNLPETISGGKSYRIQYGRKMDFAATGEMTATLRCPRRFMDRILIRCADQRCGQRRC